MEDLLGMEGWGEKGIMNLITKNVDYTLTEVKGTLEGDKDDADDVDIAMVENPHASNGESSSGHEDAVYMSKAPLEDLSFSVGELSPIKSEPEEFPWSDAIDDACESPRSAHSYEALSPYQTPTAFSALQSEVSTDRKYALKTSRIFPRSFMPP